MPVHVLVRFHFVPDQQRPVVAVVVGFQLELGTDLHEIDTVAGFDQLVLVYLGSLKIKLDYVQYIFFFFHSFHCFKQDYIEHESIKVLFLEVT